LTALGMVQGRTGDPAAIATLRRVIELDPRSPESHLNLGIALADQHQPDAALDEFTEAVKLAPDEASAHYNKGRILVDLRRYEQAVAELQRACKLDPRAPDAWHRLGVAERELRHYAEAAQAFREALRLDPRNANSSFLLGQSLRSAGRNEEALDAWKATLRIDPNHTQALYSLVRALLKTNPEQARQYQARFTALQEQAGQTERARTLSNFAIESAKAGNWDQAIAQLREAIQVCGVCSALPTLRKNLGLTECQAGRFDDGESELRLALKDMPGDAEILKALELLVSQRSKSR
jgi:tetratricopeptide (TPR) repeat protein